MFNHKKTILLTPLEEKIVILMCEDVPGKEIAERLNSNTVNICSAVKHAKKVNKIRTRGGLIVRYLGNGYLNKL